MSADPAREGADDAARVAGRGLLWIAAAKAVFMVGGYAIELGLPRLLTAALFGAYKVVIGLVSTINNMVVTGTIQGVAKFAAERDAQAEGVKRAALRTQAIVGGGLAAAFFAAAPWLAANERDPSLATPLRIAAGVILCYSLYAVFVGAANGLRRFHVQAGLDMTYTGLRALGVLGAAAAGFGIGGALGGMLAAAAVILVVSALKVGLAPVAEPFPARRLVGYMGPIYAYTLLLNLLLLVDLFLLKRGATALAPPGANADAAAKFASVQAAYYTAAQTLARVPYQGILAVAFVVFPMVSRATFESDHEATRAYVRQTMRGALLFCAAAAVVLIASPRGVLSVLYPAPYATAAAALAVLAPGQVLFALASLGNTVLNGAGRTRAALAIVVVSLAASAAGNVVAVGALGPSIGAPLAAACATTLANAIGLALTGVALVRAFGAFLPAATCARVLAAAAAAIAVGRAIPDGGKLRALGECAIVEAVFVVALVVLGEVTAEDRAKVRRIVRR